MMILDKVNELIREINKLKKIPEYKVFAEQLNQQGWYHLSECARREGVSKQFIHKQINRLENPRASFKLFNKVWIRKKIQG